MQVGQQIMHQQEALSAQTATNRAAWATSMRWLCKQRPLTRRYVELFSDGHGLAMALFAGIEVGFHH